MGRLQTALIGFSVVISGMAQKAIVYPATATHYSLVALSEILSVREELYGPREVHARVPRVLRAPKNLRLKTGEFDAHLPRQRYLLRQVESPWQQADVQTGQAYLIFGDRKKDLVELFERPEGIYLIDAGDSGVEDVDLILSSMSFPLSVQANTIAASISTAGKPRTAFLAEQAVALLGAGTSLETASLAQALENHADAAFSRGGLAGLLSALFWQTRATDPNVPQNVLHTFVALIARYFTEPDPLEKLMDTTQRQVLATTGLTPMQRHILDNYLPFLGTDGARAALRTTVQPLRFQSLRKKALELSADPRLPPEYLTKVQKLLELIEE